VIVSLAPEAPDAEVAALVVDEVPPQAVSSSEVAAMKPTTTLTLVERDICIDAPGRCGPCGAEVVAGLAFGLSQL
jgi:hypothetical protein